jgi:hypothetical protein
MRRMGFAKRWIKLIMTCIQMISYAIVVDVQPMVRILLSKGIRQVDPLTP